MAKRPDGYGVLALTRKLGEKVLVGEDVSLEVIEIRASRIRLRVTAPKRVRILRAEVGKRRGDAA
jgi:carbon storage regulator